MTYRNQAAWDALRWERDQLSAEYQQCCLLVSQMHRAAMGGTIGPVLGVVEDVASIRRERDELAAQVEVMRSALESVARELGYDMLLPEFEEATEALALPDLHSDILRKRDAKTVRDFVVAMEKAGAELPLPYGEWYANELEKSNGN